jgi:hypothetical protein
MPAPAGRAPGDGFLLQSNIAGYLQFFSSRLQ